MADLSVDETVIRGAATNLLATAAKLDDARGVLEGRLSALGACWGTTDDVATAFEHEYLPGRDDILDASSELGSMLRQLGDRTHRAAQTFVAVEQDNAATAAGGTGLSTVD